MNGWIGVDLDGTLAHYSKFKGVTVIGEPIAPMVARVKQWLAEGREVVIFTARVCSNQKWSDAIAAKKAIRDWCLHNLGKALPVTAEKDFRMDAFYDDRAFQVIPNTGEIVGDGTRRAPEEAIADKRAKKVNPESELGAEEVPEGVRRDCVPGNERRSDSSSAGGPPQEDTHHGAQRGGGAQRSPGGG